MAKFGTRMLSWFQESETAEDLEDFVQWRRRQPKNSKQMVSAECEALVAAALEATSGGPASGKKGGLIGSRFPSHGDWKNGEWSKIWGRSTY